MPWLQDARRLRRRRQPGRASARAPRCVYLEPWHADIEEFLELRDNTGEDARRTHNLNLANWIPDLFMRRVEADDAVVAVRPRRGAGAARPVGRGVRRARTAAAEAEGRYVRQVKARDLYARMMRTLAQTGNGWMTFKDPANARATRPREPGAWCTCPTCAPRSSRSPPTTETAVCNLGSVNLGRHRGRRRIRLGPSAQTCARR